jgi:hypothetical protein
MEERNRIKKSSRVCKFDGFCAKDHCADSWKIKKEKYVADNIDESYTDIKPILTENQILRSYGKSTGFFTRRDLL